MLTEESVGTIKRSTNEHSFWGPYLRDLGTSGHLPYSVHLAILLEPYLQFILEGSKTVESRFSRNRIAPYQAVQPGDVVLLKRAASKGVTGICVVRAVWFYQLDPESWDHIRKAFTSTLRADDPSFWADRRRARFATLMRIGEVHPLPYVKLLKRDRRGWVVLQSRQQPLLEMGQV